MCSFGDAQTEGSSSVTVPLQCYTNETLYQKQTLYQAYSRVTSTTKFRIMTNGDGHVNWWNKHVFSMQRPILLLLSIFNYQRIFNVLSIQTEKKKKHGVFNELKFQIIILVTLLLRSYLPK